DGFTALPIPNATINVYNSAGTAIVASPTTDAFGTYFTSTLPDGVYRAKSSVPGYNDQLFRSISCALGCNVATGTAISLPMNGISVTSVDFSLLKSTSIQGTVTGEDAASGIANVTMQAYNSAGALVQTTTTNSSGVYQFTNLIQSNYFVRSINTIGYTD